jgi:prepilin-type N-terminal cleavage/methylation domain-containing protein/prepilin-type processing-associated H-X9-DG protein
MRRHHDTEVGLTLIELLVVIAILGILAALLFTAVSSAKSHVHSTTCKNHLRQMGLALQMYVHDHNRYPYFRSLPDPSDSEPAEAEDNRYWWAKLEPYYPLRWKERRYHCAGYSGAITGVGSGHGPLGSYAYNARGVRPPFSGWEDASAGISIKYRGGHLGLGPTLYVSFPGSRRPPTSEPQVLVPSEMFAIGESRFLSAQVNGIPGGRCDMASGMLSWNVGRSPMDFAFDQARHGKTYNQLFCDGHVAAMSPWALFNPTNTGAMWNYDHKPHPELWTPE